MIPCPPRSALLIVALLWTPLGYFGALSTGLVCDWVPDPDYAGYFRREPTHPVTGPSAEGVLLVTVHARPFLMVPCRLRDETRARGETWSDWTCQ